MSPPARAGAATGALLIALAACAALVAGGALAAQPKKGARAAKPAKAAPVSPFEQGLAAFRAGDYDKALERFQRAEERTPGDPNLDLNIGLTLYKLGRYDEARLRFEKIRNDLRYTAVADYHLGLVAAQQGSREDAADRFEEVRYTAENPRLRTMAEVALLRMDSLALDQDPFTTTSAAPRPDLYARLATGYDSNPELVSDAADTAVGGQGAMFGELRGEMNLPLIETRAGTTYLRGDLQNRSYVGDHGLDQTSVEVELRQGFRIASWRVGVGAQGGNAWLDGDAYESLYGGGIDARRELSFATLTLSADTAQIEGEGQYDFLSGWRHRAGIEAARPVGAVPLRLNYEYELNDRADFDDGTESASYSPQRHSVGLTVGLPPLLRMTSEFRVRWRDSRYPDDDRTLIGGSLVDRRRDDQLLTVDLRGRVRGGAHWNWLGDLQYASNNSSLPEFAYERNTLLVGVEWVK